MVSNGSSSRLIEVAKHLNYYINDESFKGGQTAGQKGAFTRKWLLPSSHLLVNLLKIGKPGSARRRL
jgi:hypothetical protein